MKPEERERALRVTKHQAAHIVQGRTLIQPPTEADRDVVRFNAAHKGERAEGIPFDVRMTLEALRDLAAQGNLAAKWLYEREAARWNLHGGATDILIVGR